MSRMLLAGEGIGIDENQPSMPLPGFLFDMNCFYLDLLTRFLSEYVQDCAVYPSSR